MLLGLAIHKGKLENWQSNDSIDVNDIMELYHSKKLKLHKKADFDLYIKDYRYTFIPVVDDTYQDRIESVISYLLKFTQTDRSLNSRKRVDVNRKVSFTIVVYELFDNLFGLKSLLASIYGMDHTTVVYYIDKYKWLTQVRSSKHIFDNELFTTYIWMRDQIANALLHYNIDLSSGNELHNTLHFVDYILLKFYGDCVKNWSLQEKLNKIQELNVLVSETVDKLRERKLL